MDDTVVQRLRIIGDLQAEEGVYEREVNRLRRQRSRFAERIRKFSRHMSKRHRDEGDELIGKITAQIARLEAKQVRLREYSERINREPEQALDLLQELNEQDEAGIDEDEELKQA